MEEKNTLVDGVIPAFTECPFKNECEISKGGVCLHQGSKHRAPFSCAAARGFELVKEIER